MDTFSPKVFPGVVVGGTPTGSTITWNLGTVAPGTWGNLVYTALVQSGLPDGELVENSATITSTNAPSTTATHQAWVDGVPSLALTKDGPAEVKAGTTITYRLNYRNVGLGNAPDTVLQDALPADCAILDPGRAVLDATTGKWRWNLGSLAGGGGGSVIISCTVRKDLPDGSLLTNNADLNATGTWPVTAQAVTRVRSLPALEVAKTATSSQVPAGGLLTYQVEIRNRGQAPAHGVAVTDGLDANTTFVSASGGGTASAGTVTWNLGTIDPGQGTSRTLVVRVQSPLPNGTQITNSATVTSTDLAPITSNAVTIPVSSAPLLQVAKTAHAASVAAGGQISFDLTVANRGTDRATNVVLTDVLPGIATFVSASAGGTYGAGKVVWNLGTLAAGAASTVTVTLSVNSGLANGTPLLNSASVASTEAGPTSSQALVPVTSETRLTLTKTASAATVPAGGTLTYRLAYSNTGNQDATGAQLSDTLPDHVQFVSASPGGTYTASTRSVLWNLGTLRAGQAGSTELTVSVDAPLTNGTALVNAAGIGCDQAAATAQATTVVASSPLLSVQKVATPAGTVAAGKQIAYHFAYANTGTDAATAALLVDTLPAGVLDAPMIISYGGIHDPATRTVTWSLGDVPAGTGGTRDLVVQLATALASGTPLDNAVALSATNAPATNALVTNTIGSAPKLHVDLTVDRSVAPAGSPLTYAVGIRNVGNDVATGVVVEFPIPANTTHLSNSAGAVVTGGKLLLNAGSLAPGEGRSFVVYVSIAGVLPNGTWIPASSTATATNAPSDSANTATQVTSSPVLSLKKTAPAQASAGSQLVYTLDYRNAGSDAATGVVLADTLPPHTRFVSANPGGIYASGKVSWSIGTLPAGAGGSVLLVLDVETPLPNGTSLVNQASLGSQQTPPVSARATTIVSSAPRLRVEKSASTNPVQAGKSTLFTLKYFNDGSDAAVAARLVDQLPAGGLPVAYSAPATWDAPTGTLTWSLGDIPAGGSGERVVTVLFPTGLNDGLVLTNGATLSASNAPPVSVQIPVLIGSAPNLRVELYASRPTVEAGAAVEFVVDIQNIGNGTARNVTVQVQVPPNTQFVSAGAGGRLVNGTVTWTLPELAPGSGQNLTVAVKVDNPLPSGTQIVATVLAATSGGQTATSQTNVTVYSQEAPPAAEIPTLSEWGLLAMASLLAAAGGSLLRSRGPL